MCILTWAYMQFPFLLPLFPSFPLPPHLLPLKSGTIPSFWASHLASLDLLVSLLRAPQGIRHGASLNTGLMWSGGSPPLTLRFTPFVRHLAFPSSCRPGGPRGQKRDSHDSLARVTTNMGPLFPRGEQLACGGWLCRGTSWIFLAHSGCVF